MKIRPTRREDITDLMQVVELTGLFPSDLLPNMLSGFLSDNDEAEVWLTCEQTGKAIGFCYAAAEALAEGTWNMLAIAVHPEQQGGGVGAAIVSELESRLRANGNRVLIVDTSSSDAFARTRQFYAKNGYVEEARIRDFWADGDDKIVFWKALGTR